MSSIYDIAGTTSDSFSLNGKCTLLQGSNIPSNYQGQDGDIYFQDNGYLYTKSSGQWKQVNATSLPSAQESANKFLYSNGTSFIASSRNVDEIVYTDDLQNNVGDLQKELQDNVSDLQKELQDVNNSTLHKTGDNEVTLTRGNYNTRVVQQDDGNFVIYKNNKAVLACHNEEILTAPNNVNATITHSIVTTSGILKASNGYVKFGNGLIIQWGTASTGGTVTLPTSFTSSNYSVVLTRVNTDTKYHGGSYVKTLSPTNFTFSGADANSKPHTWLAIGY